MSQPIENIGPVGNQLNVANNNGIINVTKPTRWSRRFQRLKEEVEKNIQLTDFIEDLKRYNTLLDGRSMPEKLADGGFSELEIIRATESKEQYWKKSEKTRFHESAQLIDTEIFALIKTSFESYVSPMISENASQREIKEMVHSKVVEPILNTLNAEGYDDEHLNYNANDIFGMLYFLTGKCHVNWATYDYLQSGI